MKKLQVVAVSTVIAAMVGLMAGCGNSAANNSSSASTPSASSTSSSSGSSSSTASSSASSTKTAAKASSSSSQPTELVFYSAEGFDTDIAKAFQKKTGIKVKMVDMSTGPLLARLQTEKNNPKWDVAWFDGPSSMQGLYNQGMLYTKYTPSNVKNYNALGQKLYLKNHGYFPATTTAAGAIAYNKNLVKQKSNLPKDWTDLTKPMYKGEFAMNNPSISGPTYPAVYGLMMLEGNGNISKGEAFFKKLKANGMKIYDSNGPTLTNLIKGNVKYAIAQDSAIISKIQAKQPLGLIYPTSGVNTLSSNVGIDVNAPHLKAAEEFVNYVLSVEGQNVCAKANTGDANFVSIIKGAPGRQGIRPSGIKWNAIDAVAGAKHENAIKSWFNQNVVQ